MNQTINVKLFEEFKKRKIEFAYPTQSIFLAPTAKENHKEQMVPGHTL